MSQDVMELSAEEQDVFKTSAFLQELVKQVRAQDTYGTWEGKSDAVVLADFIVTKEQRKQMPIIGDPDPDVIWRIERFYNAVGLALERQTGLIAGPMIKIGHEGFGRLLMTTGRLVVISKTLRDVHRFGFETYVKLAEAGDKTIGEAIGWIEKHPDVARA
ncbi:NifX-associated nitrogen fixation protein [Insolitispirillum peregrinum]|uniref:Probable nitrogen fixation protein n=1 Tax=Insolitispirillum peregrinum TaxID=80876 RepID=A0A1N7ILC5_9PROT|nr:NifX-associated nitrogen fixation protein [Insolitispirillum peregrinum]SIS37874.1 probable nitrogen fixation protein [Insolitispirillum peregrinum]